MGSKCSILNDTDRDVWVTHGVNWDVVFGVFRGITALLLLAGVTLADFFFQRGQTETARTLRNQLSPMNMAVAAYNLGNLSLIDIERQLENLRASATLIRPGEKYTWSGTLSLMMTVYVWNDLMQEDRRACFTGPTDGSENIYPISEYFKKLDVETQHREAPDIGTIVNAE